MAVAPTSITELRLLLQCHDHAGRASAGVLPFGVAAIDQHIPGGGLHEVVEAGAWTIKALRDAPLPLFAAADDRAAELRPETAEAAVALTPMPQGREIVEDYRTKGLSLRAHPLSLLRDRLSAAGYAPCTAMQTANNGRLLSVAGLILVRQMPGSAKGVMFITLEDEGANANLIVWPKVFKANRRIILAASMLGCRGRIQRAEGVIHLIVDKVFDLTADLRQVSGMDSGAFPIAAGRGDEAKHGGHGPDSREPKQPPVVRPRDIYIPDLHINTLKVKARNFR